VNGYLDGMGFAQTILCRRIRSNNVCDNDMEPLLSSMEMIVRAIVAVLGAAVLGWERERLGKPAGLRTQMMVGLGAAIFTMTTLKLYEELLINEKVAGFDPSRVIQGVIGGIGFLGAGTIIQARGSVHGMTTAATIWVVGGLGIACGLGYYLLAGLSVVLALSVLLGVGMLEAHWIGDPESATSE